MTNILFLIIVFQSLIEEYFEPIKYFEDVFALVVFAVAVVLCVKYKHKLTEDKYELIIVICIALFSIIGTVSSAVYHYQSLQLSAMGFFLAIKWFLLAYGIKKLCDMDFIHPLRDLDNRVLICVTLIILIWKLMAVFRISCVNDFSPHDICGKAVFIFGILLCKWESFKIHERAIICTALGTVIILTGKAKGYGALALGILIILWLWKWRRQITVVQIVIAGALAVAVAWEKVYYYYIQGVERTYSRPLLFQTAFKIACDYFPIGTGWGTFASYVAALKYSPVYYLYGLDTHRELGVAHQMFLEDTYWPAPLAECGWVGAGAILVAIFVIVLMINGVYKINLHAYAAGMYCMAYMMVTTVEETGFMQPVLMCIAVLVGVILSQNNQKNER